MESFAELRRTMFAGGLKEADPTPDDCLMIIDDNVEIIEALTSLLQSHCHIVSCVSYEEAKRKLSPEIGVVLLDIKMANKDGIEVFKLLKRERADLQIIFHSAYPGSSDGARAVEDLSPSGYLTKGEYDLPELVTVIRMAMKWLT